jgi:diguanylate cyclase (GGDEF)-like protein
MAGTGSQACYSVKTMGMRRRFSYALTAGVLSSGAPAGLLGIRLARRDDEVSLRRVRNEIEADRAAYMYIGGATALIFALFGYVLGRHADQLAELSETDSLTQLLNARGFSSRLRAEIRRAKRYREPLSVLFLDVDGLKSINDRHGHRAGSQALREVAHVIRSELRATDTGARWGGDEFTILAPNTKRDEAVAFAERIRGSIASHIADWPMTASIGIATLDCEDARVRGDVHTLLHDADGAMYEAKRRGKNTVVAVQTNGATEAAPFRLA